MSEITKCQSCKGDFDDQDKIPMFLPCEHNVCYECANDQYKKNKLIKCDLQSCQKGHQIRPSQLQEDKKLLKHLEQKMLLEIISKLTSQKANLTKAQKQLSEQQSNIIYKLMKHLNDYVLKDNIALQKEIQKINTNINHQLNYYYQQQKKMNQNVKTQNFMQQSSISAQIEKTSKSLIAETQQIIQKLSEITMNVYEEFENIKNNYNQVTSENANFQKKITEQNQQIQELNNANQSYENQKEILLQKTQNQAIVKQQIKEEIQELQQVIKKIFIKQQIFNTQLKEELKHKQIQVKQQQIQEQLKAFIKEQLKASEVPFSSNPSGYGNPQVSNPFISSIPQQQYRI